MVVYYLRKIIPAKTWYKTFNNKVLVIVKAFKTWRHYLKGCKYKVLILINHNNLCWFMNTKNLSFHQVRWTQKLFLYHFWIDNQQSKANKAANALLCFLEKSLNKEKRFWAKNSQILHYLQSFLTNASFSNFNLNSLANFLLFYQIFICGIYILPQIYEF